MSTNTQDYTYTLTAEEPEKLWWAGTRADNLYEAVQEYRAAGGKLFLGWRTRCNMSALLPCEGYELALGIADTPLHPESDVVKLDMSFGGDIYIKDTERSWTPNSRHLYEREAVEMENKLLGRYGLTKEDIAFYVPLTHPA